MLWKLLVMVWIGFALGDVLAHGFSRHPTWSPVFERQFYLFAYILAVMAASFLLTA